MDFIKKTLTYKGKVVFEKIIMPRFKRIPKLYQEKEACFMFVEHGPFSVRTAETLVRFDEQNALLAKCFNYLFEMDEEQWNQAEYISAVGVLFYPSMISEVFQIDLSQPSKQLPYNTKQINVDPLLENFRDNISYLLDHPELADESLILLKLKEFVHLILRQAETTSILEFFTHLFNPVSYTLQTAIENNLYTNLTLDELASLCHMSTSNFKRKFKEHYGESPHTYLLQQKIKKAQSLLRHPHLSITQIAFECGFEHVSSFNRNFKKQVGQTPSAYRKSLI